MIVQFPLRQLEFFAAVAEAGSISGGAERCGASQAGVSLAIRDLERHLGVRLFVRRRAKAAVVTEAGLGLLLDARRLLGSADELQALAPSWRPTTPSPRRGASRSPRSPASP